MQPLMISILNLASTCRLFSGAGLDCTFCWHLKSLVDMRSKSLNCVFQHRGLFLLQDLLDAMPQWSINIDPRLMCSAAVS